MPLASRWRILDSGPADGATNMALDHALLERAATSGEAVLRIYGWSRPTLSFGMHERSGLSRAALADQGVDVVRRPTGGRALLHDREVTYSVTAPTAGTGLSESYRAINAILLQALARLGVAAAESPRRARATAPDGAPCFAEPNVGELVAAGGKLVGSAQRRDEHALLQHGSILLEDDQPRIATLRGLPPSPSTAASLNGLLARTVCYGEVRGELIAALRATAGTTIAGPLDPAEVAAAVASHRLRYASDEWTFRR